MRKTEKERIIKSLKKVLEKREDIAFAYIFGSFIKKEEFRDVDIGIFLKTENKDPFTIAAEVKIAISNALKKEKIFLNADVYDVRILNDAPFTFLYRVFREGILIVDKDPYLRAQIIEHVSARCRECSGLLRESMVI